MAGIPAMQDSVAWTNYSLLDGEEKVLLTPNSLCSVTAAMST